MSLTLKACSSVVDPSCCYCCCAITPQIKPIPDTLTAHSFLQQQRTIPTAPLTATSPPCSSGAGHRSHQAQHTYQQQQHSCIRQVNIPTIPTAGCRSQLHCSQLQLQNYSQAAAAAEEETVVLAGIMAQFITTEKHSGYATITIAKEPVNSFDTAMWAALHAAVQAVEADTSMSGLIICSGLKRDVFTAGNDLKELYAPLTSPQQYRKFWEAQSLLLTGLLNSRLATVAAIRGACPAGGCAIAICCDHRIMTDFGVIGLNEVALGIPVPKYWAGVMVQRIGHAAAERLLLSGTMVNPKTALQLGLVDELVSEKAQLLNRAHEVMAGMVKLPAFARAQTKQRFRAEYAAAWLEYAMTEEAGPQGYALIEHPDTVAAVGGALQRLSGGKVKPQPRL